MGIFQFPVHSNRYIIYLFAFTHIFGLTAKNIILFISETYNLAEPVMNEISCDMKITLKSHSMLID